MEKEPIGGPIEKKSDNINLDDPEQAMGQVTGAVEEKKKVYKRPTKKPEWVPKKEKTVVTHEERIGTKVISRKKGPEQNDPEQKIPEWKPFINIPEEKYIREKGFENEPFLNDLMDEALEATRVIKDETETLKVETSTAEKQPEEMSPEELEVSLKEQRDERKKEAEAEKESESVKAGSPPNLPVVVETPKLLTHKPKRDKEPQPSKPAHEDEEGVNHDLEEKAKLTRKDKEAIIESQLKELYKGLLTSFTEESKKEIVGEIEELRKEYTRAFGKKEQSSFFGQIKEEVRDEIKGIGKEPIKKEVVEKKVKEQKLKDQIKETYKQWHELVAKGEKPSNELREQMESLKTEFKKVYRKKGASGIFEDLKKSAINELNGEVNGEKNTEQLISAENLKKLEKFAKDFYQTLAEHASWDGYSEQDKKSTLETQTKVFLNKQIKKFNLTKEDNISNVVELLITNINK